MLLTSSLQIANADYVGTVPTFLYTRHSRNSVTAIQKQELFVPGYERAHQSSYLERMEYSMLRCRYHVKYFLLMMALQKSRISGSLDMPLAELFWLESCKPLLLIESLTWGPSDYGAADYKRLSIRIVALKG